MRNSRRNIADPISPQNPVIKKDVIETDRIQDKLEEKTSIEEIFDPNDKTKKQKNNQVSPEENHDTNLEDES